MSKITDFITKLISDYSSKAENAALAKRFPTVGKCPKCGSSVIALPKAYVCEKGKDNCGFGLARTIKEKNISEAQFRKLLEKGSTDEIEGFVSKKTGKKFSASLYLQEDKTIGLRLPDYGAASEPIGKCPKCGSDVVKGKFGFYCKGSCGMFLGKVYGKELTEEQLKTLLKGKQIVLMFKGKKTIVLPQYTENVYNGKTNYQWKTQKG